MHGGYGASIAGHAHPAIVEAVSRPRAARDAFRAAHRGCDLGRGRTRQPVRAAAVALRQLRHRGHDGRGALDARDHRAGSDHQGRGLLPRSPRLGAGVGAPEADEIGPRDHPIGVAASSGIPAAIRDLVVVVPFNDLEAVERALVANAGRVAGMILEPIMMNAGIIAPEPATSRACANCCTATMRCSRSTRSRPDSPPARAARRRATASSRTSCAWPRRSAAASRSLRSAAPRR